MSKNITGVSLSISTTTSTSVHSLLVSYIAYDSRLFNKVAGKSLVYDQYLTRQTFTLGLSLFDSLSSSIRSVFSGLTSFIIPNTQLQFNNRV